MFSRIGFMIFLTVICVCGLFSGIVAAQECIYKDEFGEPIMHTGGAALAGGLALMDLSDDFGIPTDYDTWDLNADGIPDKVSFALLTEILCMSGATVHPTINISEIQATFDDNLVLYWNMVNTVKAAEAALVAGAPDLHQVGIELGTAARAAGLIVVGPPLTSTLLPPEVFGGTLPDMWVGKTWEDLRYTLRETGDGINWLVSQDYFGDPSAVVWSLLDNTAVAYIMAALWGLDTDFTGTLFDSSYLDLLQQFLTLQQLDWSYILSVLYSYGLTATAVANAENSLETINLDDTLLPPEGSLAITSNGVDALDGSVLWGDSTLLDLYTNNGGDVAAIWEEILTQLPALPVGGMSALFAVATACALGGALFIKRDKEKK